MSAYIPLLNYIKAEGAFASGRLASTEINNIILLMVEILDKYDDERYDDKQDYLREVDCDLDSKGGLTNFLGQNCHNEYSSPPTVNKSIHPSADDYIKLKYLWKTAHNLKMWVNHTCYRKIQKMLQDDSELEILFNEWDKPDGKSFATIAEELNIYVIRY